MKAANTVFWCSFFVNQRGCPRHQHKPLFNYLVENNDILKSDDKEFYQREFIKAHDELLNKFVDSIDDLCEEWVNSEAGVAFIAIFDKKKYIPLLSCLISGNPTNQGRSSPSRAFALSLQKMEKQNLASSLMGNGSGASLSQFFGFMTSTNHQKYLVHRLRSNLRGLNGHCLRLTVGLTKMNRGTNVSLLLSWNLAFPF